MTDVIYDFLLLIS